MEIDVLCVVAPHDGLTGCCKVLVPLPPAVRQKQMQNMQTRMCPAQSWMEDRVSRVHLRGREQAHQNRQGAHEGMMTLLRSKRLVLVQVVTWVSTPSRMNILTKHLGKVRT